jgi:hypothetical protein
VVGGNAALWLRLDNLSERGGGGQPVSTLRDRVELARRVAGCNNLLSLPRARYSEASLKICFMAFRSFFCSVEDCRYWPSS